MPRKGTGSKPKLPFNPGVEGQAPDAPPGLPYGERARSVEAQRAIPLPVEPDVAPETEDAALLAALSEMPFRPNPINRPSERPNEPVTHGLVSGPGGGPEVLPGAPSQAALYHELARATGDSTWTMLARRAARRGR